MTSQSQSAATGLASIVGALLGAWLASRGLALTPDQIHTVTVLLAGGGAAIVGGLTHLVGNLLRGKSVPTVPPVAKLLPLLLVAGIVMSLSGCAIFQNAAAKTALQASVDVAVGAAIQQAGPAQAQQARAAEIEQISTTVEKAVTDPTTTVAQLQLALSQAIAAAKLPPADQLAIGLVATTLGQTLQQELTSGTSPLNATDKADITQVLSWVQEAAGVYLQQMRAALAHARG